MPKRSTLLLTAGVIAGGCSRDAPIAGPVSEPVPAVIAPATAVAAKAGSTADGASIDIDDAVTRLLPALDEWGSPLREPLLRLQARKKDRTASSDVQNVVEVVSTTLPSEYRPDFDALRLALGIAIPE